MNNVQIYGAIMGSILFFVLVVWAAYNVGYVEWRDRYEASQLEVQRLKELNAWIHHKMEENVDLMTAEIETQVERRMREWMPDQSSIAADFDQALRVTEYMRKNRETIDSGRLHPPREDSGGEPAVIRSAFAPRKA